MIPCLLALARHDAVAAAVNTKWELHVSCSGRLPESALGSLRIFKASR